MTTEFDHLFRHSYGKIVASLVNKFGSDHLDKIEDAVQDALLKGMQVWSYQSMPSDPTAWLFVVAKNRMLDFFRSPKSSHHLIASDPVIAPKEAHLDIDIVDDQLRMMFACCHPRLSQEYQIVLTLKLVAGFHNREVASALLKKEDTVAKAFTRAKAKFRQVNPTLSIPIEIGLQSRLNIVLKIVYLIFTEGYSSSTGRNLIKRDLCFEAIRLALLLTENKYCNRPNVFALIALMCFHASRFDARTDEKGHLIDLENQNRQLWDQELISIGRTYLSKATAGPEQPTSYLFEAFISFYHCDAESFEKTAWDKILQLYDLQMKYASTPMVELNRIVAFHQVYGAHKALRALEEYAQKPHAILGPLFYAFKGKILRELDRNVAAFDAYRKAIERSNNEAARAFWRKKMDELGIDN